LVLDNLFVFEKRDACISFALREGSPVYVLSSGFHLIAHHIRLQTGQGLVGKHVLAISQEIHRSVEALEYGAVQQHLLAGFRSLSAFNLVEPAGKEKVPVQLFMFVEEFVV